MKSFTKLRLSFCIMLMLAISSIASAQKTVTSIITSDDGNPMSGVTVTEKGTKNIVVSGATGLFSIKVASEQSILVFSSTSYSLKKLWLVTQPTSVLNYQLTKSNWMMWW